MKSYNYNPEYNKIYENLSYKNVKLLEGKYIFLTGGAGFIGSWFLDFFSFLNKEVLKTPCNILCAEHNSNIQQTDFIKTIKLDLAKPFDDDHFKKWKFDFIIHLAGISSPQEYSKFPLETLDLSYLGTKNVLELARKHKVKSILCFSSAAVYGNPEPNNVLIDEEHVGAISPFSDRSSYTIGKKVLETLCHFYHTQFDVPIKIVRPFNIYGPRMGKSNVIKIFIDKILKKQPIMIYGDGQQARSFCYITDAINGFLRVLFQGKSGHAYNIGSSNAEKNMIELTDLLFEISNRSVNIKMIKYPDNYPKNEPKRCLPNILKANKEIGYFNSVSLEEGAALLISSETQA